MKEVTRMATTYKAKTITGAERRVRELRNQVHDLHGALTRALERERLLLVHRQVLAKLSAEGPALDNPLVIAAVKELRNKVLREECGMNPDGTPLKP